MRLVANIVLRDKNDRNFLINRPIRKTLVGLFSRVFFKDKHVYALESGHTGNCASIREASLFTG